MSNPRHTIEALANVAILVVAVLLSIVLVKNYLLRPALSTARAGQAAARPTAGRAAPLGEQINLPDVDWRQHEQGLVLALSSTCHFCTESAPFYRRLLAECGGRTQIVAVLPQSQQDGRQYLSRLGLTIADVRQAALASIGVEGTPTLLLVDRNGVVQDAWVEKLPPAEEARVFSRLRQSTALK
jgi:hypothetical protein